MSESKALAIVTASQSAQASSQSSDGAERRSNNIRIVQNVVLIWLDGNIENNNIDCHHAMMQLRRAINSITTITDSDQCIQFLQDMNQEKVCIITTGYLGRHFVPRVHSMPQVDSIYIFCGNKDYHERWAKDWSKIKGVFTEIAPIYEALKKTVETCEQNTTSISIMAAGNGSKKNLDQLDPSFMYIQIMKEILLTINFEPKHFNQYIEYCRNIFAENDYELHNIEKLERQYRDITPIWWYTFECFLYPMLNRGLRMMDVDIIMKMGFFIKDLHNHIVQLHKEQFNDTESNGKFSVYRGQGMSKVDFEQLTKNRGGLIAFNNFLSTSKDRSVSLDFAHRALDNPDLMGVLFVMTIDPSQSTTPFASIKDVSAIQSEEEVLFSTQTVFRIGNITPMDGNSRLFEVELTLTGDNDKDLRQLTDCIREATFPDEEGWYRLGVVLGAMSQFDKAKEVYQIQLEQATNESEKAAIYNQLGLTKSKQGEYEEAIAFYEKDLEISQKLLPSNHPDLAKSYNNIGLAYKNIGEYSKALLYYEKALEIKQQVLPSNHPSLAMSYNNIGIVYKNMRQYSKAFSYYEKSLEIRKESLPSNHPDLAMSYNNIGLVYKNMGEYSKALSYYEKSLEIKQQSLPSNHPDLATSYCNIGVVYKKMGEYSKALSYYEKDLEITQKSLPSNHPNLAMSCYNIGLLYEDMANYPKAQSFYERAVNIGQQSLPTNHTDLRDYRKKLDDIKNKL